MISQQIASALEPIAAWFRTLNMPEPIIHWGHPLMMGIVVFVVGGYVGYAGWKIRTTSADDVEAMALHKKGHRTMAPLMFTFMALGYTGGVLSLVMQQQEIFASPHFWTGSIVLILLAANGAIATFGFGQENGTGRKAHAYLGSAALALMVLHAAFGLGLGLSI